MMLANEIDLTFDGKVIRIVDRFGEPWFVLNDVCRVLGIKNVGHAARRLDAEDKADIVLSDVRSRQGRTMIIVSEPGALQIILRSDAAVSPGTFAYRFRRWVTHEVLPSIRKHGTYPPPAKIEVPVQVVVFETATQCERLLAEMARVASIYEVGPEALVKGIISKAQITSIRSGTASVQKLLAEKGRAISLMSLGFHIPWIIWGQQIMHPDEANPPDYLRLAEPS